MPMGVLGGRRGSYLLIAAVVATCGFVVALRLAPPARADLLDLDVTLTQTSMTVTYNGATLPTSGGTVPVGCWDVVVTDNIPGPPSNPTTTQPSFTMSGPGVSVPPNDLDSTGMGPDAISNFGPFVFTDGSTYTVANQSYAGQSMSFSATGSGTTSCSSESSGSQTSTPMTTMTTTTTSTMPTSKTPTTPKVLGTLACGVSASGTATFTEHGKAVKSLKPGLYKITVGDHSKKAGLFLGEGSKTKVTLSGIAATGTSTHSVTFTAGTWWIKTTSSGAKKSFKVT